MEVGTYTEMSTYSGEGTCSLVLHKWQSLQAYTILHN